jgi:hypothetical protein
MRLNEEKNLKFELPTGVDCNTYYTYRHTHPHTHTHTYTFAQGIRILYNIFYRFKPVQTHIGNMCDNYIIYRNKIACLLYDKRVKKNGIVDLNNNMIYYYYYIITI